MNLRSLPGGVPEPEELIGRDHLIDVLWNQLAGNNILHLIIFQIILDPDLKDRPLTPEEVKDVYHRRVLGPACRSHFDFYRQRLKRYGAPAEQAAIAILREIANTPSGRVSHSALYDVYRRTRRKGASDVEFLEIMADLECDWYASLDTTTNEYYFLIDIMKDWWKRFYRSLNVKKTRV